VNEGIDRNSVMARLEKMGIAAKPYLPSIHLQPFYVEDFGHAAGELPITERISASTLSLPFFAEMTEAQVDTVCTSLAQAIDDEVAGR
jgi:dTDP-4-amino-4,6-dideoxygalactose transaminase